MGLFDKLADMKREHDRKVAEEQERARQERERIKREAAEREKAIYDRLESSNLMKELVKVMTSYDWFSQSQGSWDKNRRQIIITPVNLFFNNYDEDTFFTILEKVSLIGAERISYTMKRDYQGAVTPWGEIIRAPSRETMENDRIIERYETTDSYHNLVLVYESYGCAPFSDAESMGYFAKALKNILKRMYPSFGFSDFHRNSAGFLAFEMIVLPSVQKTIL